MNNKSIVWRDEAVAAIAASYSPHAERAKEVIIDAQLAVMGLPEAALNVWRWHPYPEEKPPKNGKYLAWFETDIWIDTYYCNGHWNGHEGSCEHEFTDVIAWAEIVPYRRQSDAP